MLNIISSINSMHSSLVLHGSTALTAATLGPPPCLSTPLDKRHQCPIIHRCPTPDWLQHQPSGSFKTQLQVPEHNLIPSRFPKIFSNHIPNPPTAPTFPSFGNSFVMMSNRVISCLFLFIVNPLGSDLPSMKIINLSLPVPPVRRKKLVDPTTTDKCRDKPIVSILDMSIGGETLLHPCP